MSQQPSLQTQDTAAAVVDFLPMPTPPHPRIGWAFTRRPGGFSRGAWGALGDGEASPAPGLNLGALCGDDAAHVARNRQLLATSIGRPISWLKQVHGRDVYDPDQHPADAQGQQPPEPAADAQISIRPDRALAVLVADCLPVLFADRQGRVVGSAHAGWRGLLDGVLESTVQQMRARVPDADIVAWLGPCIGPGAFEVGEEVRSAFVSRSAEAEAAFVPGSYAGKWLANLPLLARQRLARAHVDEVIDSGLCTVSHPEQFWSFRRDRSCGRMAGLIWLKDQS